MKPMRIIIVFIIIISGITSIHAQTTDKYEKETIYMQAGKYAKNDHLYSPGFLGKNLKQEMTISPDALDVFEKYQKSIKWGIALSSLALISAVVSLSIKDKSVSTGLFGITTAAVIVNYPLARSSTKNFNKAIWLRNRDVLK